MATGKRYYWIKLREDFMTSDTVDYFMSQPNGADYVVLYQMLCLKTINTGGKLSRQIGEIIISYDIDKIQRDCKWFSADTIRTALTLYKSFGLIYEDQNGILVLAEHCDLVGSETDYAEKKRNLRAQKKIESLSDVGDNVSTDVSSNVHIDIRDKRLDIRDKEKETKEKEKTAMSASQEEQSCPFVKIKNLYHEICVSFPKIKAIDGNRRKAVSARWRAQKSLDVFEELFRIAEASSFLKGDNDRNWAADFDWMMKPTNFSKILEHKYDKREDNTVKTASKRGIPNYSYKDGESL